MIEAADNFIAADVMELADMQDLGSCAARRAGSSPVIRIKTPERRFRGFLRMETLNPGIQGLRCRSGRCRADVHRTSGTLSSA